MSYGADEYGNQTARVRHAGQWLRVEFDRYQRSRGEVLMQLANEAVVASRLGGISTARGIRLSGDGGGVL